MPAFGRFVLFFFLVFLGSCSYFRQHEPYGGDLPVVRHLEPVQRELEAADSVSAHVLLTDIGQVAYGGVDAPLWRLAYRPFQPGLKHALVLSGTHGDEVAGVFYALKLVDTLANSPETYSRWDADIFPIVNPWGWVYGVPFNPKGVDIGSDFATFDSSEARLIRRFLREKQYDLVVDLREDPGATGFSIRQYGLQDNAVAEKIIRRLRASGYAIELDSGAMRLKPKDGIIDVPMWRLKLMRLFRQLTMAGYLRQNVSNTVFTVQTPAVVPLSDRIAMQQIAMETLFTEYGAQEK
jgi:hypothetical protein